MSVASSQSSSAAKAILAECLVHLPGRAEVEELIRSKFDSESPSLQAIPEYLFALGGKRMRPVLTLLSAAALGMRVPSPRLIEIAAGIELIHMATLLHDDIIDKSPIRRHKESAFLKFGVPNTLLAGDFLLVRAFSLCARLDRHIIDATEQACVELTEGEIEEIPLFRARLSVAEVLEIARKKTAALFRLATDSAAFLTVGKGAALECFMEFGEKLGVAFQILDDVLDVISTEDLLGKKAGQDLLERKPSVVNVLWLESGAELSKRLLTEPQLEGEDQFVQQALHELRHGETIKRARALAIKYAREAESALDAGLAQAPEKNPTYSSALYALIRYTTERLE